MDLAASLDLLMILALCAALLIGFPVAFTLAGIALIFAGLGWAFGVFDMIFVAALPQRLFGAIIWNEVLLAVPLFVFMGVMLERSKVAEDLLETMGQLFGRLRGGLGICVILVGMLLAASTGVVGATVVTMGLIALPTMIKHGYSKSLACGSVCAAGTLGQIIPPSIVLVILGDQLSSAYIDAQRGIGNLSPEPLSVGDLFAGALLPGCLLVALYLIYQIVVAWRRPLSAPAIARNEGGDGEGNRALARQVLVALVPPVLLIVGVLGSILAGIATPSEAAAIGALGALLLAGHRTHAEAPVPILAAAIGLLGLLVLQSAFDLRLHRAAIPTADMLAMAAAMVACAGLLWGVACAIWRLWQAGTLRAVNQATLDIVAMIFVILIGASLFSLVFRGLGGNALVEGALAAMPGGYYGALIGVMLVMFILGFFLDFIEITLIVVPLVAPALLATEGVSPVWIGVLMAMNLQTSFLTPPFGFALFYLRGVTPDGVRTADIYKGVLPFIAIQLFALGLLIAYPGLANWLPGVLFGSDFTGTQ